MNAKQHGGSRPGSGRKRRAIGRKNGDVWVRLSNVGYVRINSHTFQQSFKAIPGRETWHVDGEQYTDYAAAVREFERRVNETK